MGRPSVFKQETADIICERIADGESLRAICLSDDMPARSTVFKWLAEMKSFSDQYARAKDEQAETLFDEILNIADDGSNDWMEKNFGDDTRWVENGEAIRRSQMRIDARKWMAGKLKPKKYSDKVVIAGDEENPLTTVTKIELVAPGYDNSENSTSS